MTRARRIKANAVIFVGPVWIEREWQSQVTDIYFDRILDSTMQGHEGRVAKLERRHGDNYVYGFMPSGTAESLIKEVLDHAKSEGW